MSIASVVRNNDIFTKVLYFTFTMAIFPKILYVLNFQSILKSLLISRSTCMLYMGTDI